MPDLVIVIPFAADERCDLDQSAGNMKEFFDLIRNHRLGENVGAVVNDIVIVHEPTAHQCAEGDYVILFAHGDRGDSNLTNNRGQYRATTK